MVKKIESKEEFDAVISSGKVALIDYYADWCGPCRQISPIFQKFEDEHKEKEGVEFYKVNVDDLPDVAAECGIRAMPTFHAYKNKSRIHELVGANPQGLQTLVDTGLKHL